MKNIPVIHQTDIFHHHADPDDHWDLACQFALNYIGDIDLKAVLIDYPPKADFFGWDTGDPAIGAISQLNYITGKAVPFGIGTEEKISSADDANRIAMQTPLNSGLALVFKILEEADEPVVIHVVGSCREMAAAALIRPELFKEKCKAIYLNAGTAIEGKTVEYNTALDPFSYSQLFKVPCPLYWMPCFHTLDSGFKNSEKVYGTYYRFQQKSIFAGISDNLKKYFTYALGKVMDQRWLSYLKRPVNEDILTPHGNLFREMWCTAGFLHTAGKTVTTDGDIVPLGTPNVSPVFDFIPINISCSEDGRTNWNVADKSSDRYIFKVLDTEAYPEAMTKAMRTLLVNIP